MKRNNAARSGSRKLVRKVTGEIVEAGPRYRRKVPGFLVPKVYVFKRLVSVRLPLNPASGINGANSYSMALQWRLSAFLALYGAGNTTVNVPGYTEFTGLFDQFRIHHVDVKLYFSNNTSTTASNTTFLPTLYYSEDNDNSSSTFTLESIQQRGNVKLLQLGSNGNTNNIRTIKVNPSPAVATYNGTFSAYSQPNRKQWIDCTYPDTQHYGMRIFWDTDATASAAIGYLNVVSEMYFEFKNVV